MSVELEDDPNKMDGDIMEWTKNDVMTCIRISEVREGWKKIIRF